MRTRRWLIPLAVIVALVLAGVAAYAATSRSKNHHATSPVTASASGSRVSSTYMFDVTDKRQLAGWADDVFLGRVIEQSGAGFVPSAGEMPIASEMPYTLFRVQILMSLKGALSGVVELRQDGNAVTLIESDPQLTAGEVCLFVTKGAYDPKASQTGNQPAPGRPRVVNGFGDLRALDATTKASLLAKFRDAVANQIAFGQ